MKVSLEWLNEYIKIDDLSPEQVSDTLTSLGIEVEETAVLANLDEKIICGQITSCKPHPEADKLQLCEVKISESGDAAPLSIVCGAPNARTGIYVAVAQIGSVLPGDFKIKKSKIRGVSSDGMLCSEKELQIGDGDAGIMELEAVPLGTTLIKALKLDDIVLDLSITPNRGDCNSYLGIARELAAGLGRDLKTPETPTIAPSAEVSSDAARIKEIKIGSVEECSRFSGINLTLGEKAQGDAAMPQSPWWMKRRLMAAGMRSINVFVDISNYIMLETNHPNHAYDSDTFTSSSIRVGKADKSLNFQTLDDKEHAMHFEDLMIWDEKTPVGIAGVMGGANCEVGAGTKNIFLEVANFNSVSIRKTAKRLAIHSEASYRFERGVDPLDHEFVCGRFLDLAQKIFSEAGTPAPQLSSGFIDCTPGYNIENYPKSKIALRISRAKDVLGLVDLGMKESIDILSKLGFSSLDKPGDRMVFEVPSWRRDIEKEIDLIEEIARVKGYDNIPMALPKMNIASNWESSFSYFSSEIKRCLAVAGLNETVSFPFMGEIDNKHLSMADDSPLSPNVRLKNPINEERPFLVTSLLPGLLTAWQKNHNLGQKSVQLFEIGRAFSYKDFFWRSKVQDQPYPHLTTKTKAEAERPMEVHLLSVLMGQPYLEKSWNGPQQSTDFEIIKGTLVNLLHSFGINQCHLDPIKDSQLSYMLNPQSAYIMANMGANYNGTGNAEPIGYLGSLHPQVSLNYGMEIAETPFVMEINLQKLWHLQSMAKQVRSREISSYPAVTRDLAFVVDEGLSFADLAGHIESHNKKKFMKSFQLFDVYQGKGVPENKKSMALAFSFQDPAKTLKDKEVDKEITSLISWLGQKCDAQLRS